MVIIADDFLVSVSKKTLERVESIKQSSVAHLSTTEGHSSSSEDDNDIVEKELLEITLKKYYMSLATVGNDADERDKQCQCLMYTVSRVLVV